MYKAILALGLTAGFAGSVMAAEYKGYIIDEKCSKVASMKGDVDCANKCMKAGSPAVLLTDSGKVYKIANQDFAGLKDHAGHKVALSGDMKGDTITVSKIEMKAEKPAAKAKK